jgi:hypothetical protein
VGRGKVGSVLFALRFADPIARGEVDLTFRRWRRGLTHSLPVGYELSPRGHAVLDAARSR